MKDQMKAMTDTQLTELIAAAKAGYITLLQKAIAKWILEEVGE